jgi:hypothetical protein
MIKFLTNEILKFVVLVLLQVIVLNKIQFSGLINPYFYILFILLLSFEIPNWFILILAFCLGLCIDIFTHTIGMHTAATVIMAYFRPSILKLISPRDGYDNGTAPRIHYYGLMWFSRYVLALVLIHHCALFFIEMFRVSDFFFTFFRIILSTIFTSLLIILSQYFIYRD